MSVQVHRDPTFDAACRLEIHEKNCSVCQRRVVLADQSYCGVDKKFPACKRQRGGFLLIVEGQ